jgi:hypothetical protein
MQINDHFAVESSKADLGFGGRRDCGGKKKVLQTGSPSWLIEFWIFSALSCEIFVMPLKLICPLNFLNIRP